MMNDMKRKFFRIVTIVGAIVLSGCTMTTPEIRTETDKTTLTFYSDETKQVPEASKEKKQTVPQTPPSNNNVTNKKMYPTAPQMSIDTSKRYNATLKTDAGDIIVELAAKETPITVNNFVFLAREKFYDQTIFHRTINGFMIQGGDPTGTGTGNPGYRFADEPFTGEYVRGTVAMANSGPDTNGSQFFIMHKDNPLPPNYVIFGHVTSGLEIVDKIAEAPVQRGAGGEHSSPVVPVAIRTVEISEQ